MTGLFFTRLKKGLKSPLFGAPLAGECRVIRTIRSSGSSNDRRLGERLLLSCSSSLA